MKKPVATISNDWHLKTQNLDVILDAVVRQVNWCVDNDVKELYIAGDVFESRSSQRIDVMMKFMDILDHAAMCGVNITAIAGNHDKSMYKSEESFLAPFMHHPSMNLIVSHDLFHVGNLDLYFIPFFTDDILIEKIESIVVDPSKKSILISHFAVHGSINNDGTEVHSSINGTLLNKFYSVLLGHYHDMHSPLKNVYHLPSIVQHNFGENSDKGFTVLYDDGSHELVRDEIRRFETVKVDIDIITPKEIKEVAKQYANPSHRVRIEFSGSEEKIKSLKKEIFTNVGVEVTTKQKKMDFVDTTVAAEMIQYNSETIGESFKAFCEKNSLDYNKGIIYLNRKLDERNIR